MLFGSRSIDHHSTRVVCINLEPIQSICPHKRGTRHLIIIRRQFLCKSSEILIKFNAKAATDESVDNDREQHLK